MGMNMIQNETEFIECICYNDILSVPLPHSVALVVETNLRKLPEIDVLREVSVMPATTEGKSIVRVRLTGTIVADYTSEDYWAGVGAGMSNLLDAILDAQVRLRREIHAVMERQAAG